jgi:hypothetical protein
VTASLEASRTVFISSELFAASEPVCLQALRRVAAPLSVATPVLNSFEWRRYRACTQRVAAQVAMTTTANSMAVVIPKFNMARIP